MIITNTITKKLLENLVQETFSKFGIVSSSALLDCLKLLGFSAATSAGISINLEDLKTPDRKKNFINTANLQIQEISSQWQQGNISDTERFQTIIDSWNIATESLKNRIVEYYQNYDPTNNLYIMAFSGARGNMSQVRQLVGMRGLMSDQDGKIIDLPIQANFREGLSSIDYIISSYGARKGIVDTALKTADSGYLTRRLIYIAQDLIIREKNCKTQEGILFFLEKNTNVKNIIGRSFISIISLKSSDLIFQFEDNFLTFEKLNFLKKYSPLLLNIRSSLTCKSNSSICQNCYGWDLAHNKIVSLGEAIGILAAQSIGEPGTQLTMRTFHTGGIFTGELLKQILIPFSGKLIFPESMKTISYRTSHGQIVLKLQQEIFLNLINWKGDSKEIFLDIGSYLYFSNSCFVKKGELLAEAMTQSILPGGRRLKPIFSSFSGEIRFENLLIRKMMRDKRTIKVNQDDGILWIAGGKLFLVPNEIKYIEKKEIFTYQPFGKLNLIFPKDEGYVKFFESQLILITESQKYLLDFKNLKILTKNCFSKLTFLLKNYQFIDSYTIFAIIYFFSSSLGKIYSIRKKNSKHITLFFFITELDIWKVNSDHVNDFSYFQEKKMVFRSGTLIHSTLKMKHSGFFLKKDGLQMIFQHALPIFLSRGTILNYKQGDFILEKKAIATLVNYTQQTEDIVQGLPKIEELIEARKPKIKSYLATRPGILFNSYSLDQKRMENSKRNLKKNVLHYNYNDVILYPNQSSVSTQKKKIEKHSIYIGQSIFIKESLIIFQNKIYKFVSIPSFFSFSEKSGGKKDEFVFKTKKKEPLLIDGKASVSPWLLIKRIDSIEEKKFILWKYEKNNLTPWLQFDLKDYLIFKNKEGNVIISDSKGNSIFLEYLTPLVNYELPLSSKLVFEVGSFIDIGEPITEGIIDLHELLHIFFNYHLIFDGILIGTKRSLQKFQLLLVNSIQSIYQSQGVNISSKHIEIIVKQMTTKVVIKESGDSPLLPGELIRFSFINQIYESFKLINSNLFYKRPKFEPLLLSATTSSLTKDGFLSSAGFQETKRVLTKAAIEGSSDWIRGLKECIIIGRLIPAGSAFLNYKNYLDNIYLFKN